MTDRNHNDNDNRKYRPQKISVSDEDLNLVPPLCYLSRPFNHLLGVLIGSLFHCRWLVLPIVLFGLFIGVVLYPDDWFLVLLLPLMALLYSVLTYAGAGIVLLAFAARHPGTRVTFALMILVMALQFLLLSLSDTRLFLSAANDLLFWMLLLSLVISVFASLHYGRYLLPYARGATPVLVLVLAVLFFESGWLPPTAYRYSRIPAATFEVENCTTQTRWIKALGREVSSRYCDLKRSGSESVWLKSVLMPDQGFTSLEIRHGLLNHYRAVSSESR